VVRVCGSEHLHDTRERRLGARSHVDRLGGQPHGVDADQRSHSRSQAAHEDADSNGQCTTAVALPRFSSMRMSRAGISASGCTSSAMKSGIGKVGTSVAFGDAALRSSARHRCTTFAFRLYSLAIAAAEASGCRHASRTSALNRALCLRRVARLTTPSIASTSFIADTMPADSQAIKMTSPCAYA
jgi:hypothetical protein